MQGILANYPWMIWTILISVILFIFLVVLAFKTKEENNESTKCSLDEEVEEAVLLPLKKETVEVVEETISNDSEVTKESNDVNEKVELIVKEETIKTRESSEEVIKEDSVAVESNDKEEVKESSDDVIVDDSSNQIEKKPVKKVVNTKKTTDKKDKEVTENKTMKEGNNMTNNTTAPKTKTNPQGKYEIFEVEGTDSFKYILKASNGQKLIESDLYASKENVKNAIEAIKRNIETGKYNIHRDKNDMFQFKLTASNNRPIAVSANYVSKQNAEKALESFKRFAAGSPIVEVEEPKDSLVEEIKIIKEDLQVNGKIVISNSNDTWTFRLYANNGELLCTSKPYASKANCEEGVETFRTSVVDGIFLVVRDKNKLYQFKLQTASKRLVVIGQTYEDKQRAVSSAQSVASFSDDSKVVFE